LPGCTVDQLPHCCCCHAVLLLLLPLPLPLMLLLLLRVVNYIFQMLLPCRTKNPCTYVAYSIRLWQLPLLLASVLIWNTCCCSASSASYARCCSCCLLAFRICPAAWKFLGDVYTLLYTHRHTHTHTHFVGAFNFILASVSHLLLLLLLLLRCCKQL